MGSSSSKAKQTAPVEEPKVEEPKIEDPPADPPAEPPVEPPTDQTDANMSQDQKEKSPAPPSEHFSWGQNPEDDDQVFEDMDQEKERPYLPYHLDDALPQLEDCVSSLMDSPQLPAECDIYVELLAEAFARWPERNEDYERLVEELLDYKYAEMIKEVWRSIFREDLFEKRMSTTFNNGMILLNLFVKMCTDNSYACSKVMEVGFYRDVLGFFLEEPLRFYKLDRSRLRKRLALSLLQILYHIVRNLPDARAELLDSHAVDVLKKLHGVKYRDLQLLSFMVQSYIFTERELIGDDFRLELFQGVIQTLEAQIKNAPMVLELTTEELLDCLNRLAIFDNFKEHLVRAGALRCYARLMKHDVEINVKLKSVRGVWLLSFLCGSEIRRNQALMAGLRRMESSSDEELGGAAEGALWIIEERDKEANMRWFSRPPQRYNPDRGVGVSIFISYNSSDQLPQRIAHSLSQSNFHLIMNDSMPMDEMVKSVNESSIVVVCVSQNYKESPRCRTEARYIHRRNKLLVPIKLQPSYDPDGWVEILLENKSCIDFTKSYLYEQSLDKLIRVIRNKCPNAHGVYRNSVDERYSSRLPDISQSQPITRDYSRNYNSTTPQNNLPPPAPPQKPSMIPLPPVRQAQQKGPVRPVTVTDWSQRDVDNWVARNEIEHLHNWFRGMNGEMLKNFALMRRDAPETYFAQLFRGEMQMSDVMAITAALEKLNIT